MACGSLRQDCPNDNLAFIYHLTGDIEKYDSRFQRVTKLCKNSGMRKSLIKEIADDVQMTIFKNKSNSNLIAQNNYSISNLITQEKSPDNSNSTKEAVYNYIINN